MAECGECPAEAALAVIGGKWKVPIVWHLQAGTRRFSEIRRQLPRITPRMLARQLRELETDGVVIRFVHAQVPPRVDYTLTPRGRTLTPAIAALCRWGASQSRSSGRVAGSKARHKSSGESTAQGKRSVKAQAVR
jgi:DNA-binding HxlR family transcriptional regulator